MEKEFSTEWQSVLDAIIQRLLNEAEKKVLELRTTACQSLANSLRQNGFDAARLASMLNTANRSATSALKSAFHRMQVLAVGKKSCCWCNRLLSHHLICIIHISQRKDACDV
jgi:hypothetical protein